MVRELSTSLSVADIAQRVLRLQGQPYSLGDYPMFHAIYNSGAARRVMRAGRQVSKSVTLAGDMVLNTILAPYVPVMYCNSSSAQTASFSTSKLDPFLNQSPAVFHNFMRGPRIIDNVYSKRLSNHSEILLSYFSESADRVRGKSGHHMYLDEVQDMLYDAMIDAEECLSAAPSPRVTYAGTSKTLITPLEYLWSKSTQREWIIPCGHCGKWNRPSRENIGTQGLICKKCGGAVDTRSGRWHAFNPPSDGRDAYAEGFWIPQIILPMHCLHPEKWHKLLEKLETYPDVKFDNEVLGLPSGEGDSPVTEELLRAMCMEELPPAHELCPKNSSGAAFIVAGIDWGGGGNSGISRTVLSIFAVHPEQPLYLNIFGKIYAGGEPVRHVEDIAQWLIRFGCHMVCGDHGGGNFAMSQLRGLLPAGMRLVPVMYTDSAAPYKWDDHACRYTVNRTTVIDTFFTDIKRGYVRCFRWEDFEPFARDILNVREAVIGEEHGRGRRVWRRRPDLPDDALHSMVFGWFAARVLSLRLDFSLGGDG